MASSKKPETKKAGKVDIHDTTNVDLSRTPQISPYGPGESEGENAGGRVATPRQQSMFNERAREIRRRNGESTDPIVKMFLQDILPRECKEVVFANRDDRRKLYLEACLLATDDFGEVASILDMEEKIVELYALVFFDMTRYDRVARITLIERCKDEAEKNLKMWALTQGIGFIAWRLGKQVALSPVEGLASLYADCYYKAKEAFHNPNATEASREGLKWAKQAVDISRLLKSWVTDSSEAVRDIELALKEITGDNTAFKTVADLAREDELGLGSKVDGTEIGIEVEVESVEGEFQSLDDITGEGDEQ